MPPRLTIEEVKETIELSGCKLISKEYNTNKLPLELLCSCGNNKSFKIRLDAFKKGIRCAECREERTKATNLVRHGVEYVSQRENKKLSSCSGMLKHVLAKKHTIDKLKPLFEAQGCELLEENYINSKTPMKFRCICGKLGKISYSHFKQGKRCNSTICMNTRKKETNIKNYGAPWYTGTDAYNSSKFKTCMEKYGVPDPLQSAEVQDKIERSSYRFKSFILPSGNIVKLQGYEHLALKELLLKYNEKEILIGRKAQPVIWWTDTEGKDHRYFSDFYIPREKKVIEVKSTWTLEKGIECLKIPAIQAAVEGEGFIYSIMVYDYSGRRVEI
jgi:hypothetical protein